MAAFMGRPLGLHTEECAFRRRYVIHLLIIRSYDVELPLEVDDEYWHCGFTQPPDQPSLLSYLGCLARLCEVITLVERIHRIVPNCTSQILGEALRRLYASNKSKELMGLRGPEWEQRAVAELDSAMNDWLGSVPPHRAAKKYTSAHLCTEYSLQYAGIQRHLRVPFLTSQRHCMPRITTFRSRSALS
jgi:hypothetical protein